MYDKNIRWNFTEFGKNIQIVAISTVLSIAFPFLLIVSLVFFFIALENLRKVNYQLNDQYLHTFRKKYVTAFIAKIIGIIILAVGIALIVIPFFDYFYIWDLIYGIIPIIIGLIALISGSVIEMRAWENLKEFFEMNRENFPELIIKDAIVGSSKLRSGALCYALWFLGITILIGFILQAVGYFKLAKLSKWIEYPDQEKTIQAPPKVIQEPIMESTSNFCYSCGARTNGLGSFCAECGSVLD